MTTFDRDRYLKIQSGAVALADSIHAIIGGCVARGAIICITVVFRNPGNIWANPH